MKLFSLIIPTYNRFCILLQMLRFFQNQNFAKFEYEFIIVFDGKSKLNPKEKNSLLALEKKGFEIRTFFSPQKKGQAFCRNIGICKAAGKIVLFLDDDILPQKNLLYEHFQFLKNHPRLVSLGKVITLYPKGKNSDNIFTFLAENSLEQLATPSGMPLKASAVYTGNLAFYKNQKIFFPAEVFSTYGYEDVVLGDFLSKAGYTILKNNSAIVYHRKALTLEQLQKRAIALGKTFSIWKPYEKIPPLSRHYGYKRKNFNSLLKKLHYYKKYKDFYFSEVFNSENQINFETSK